jgi:hypothetical protein
MIVLFQITSLFSCTGRAIEPLFEKNHSVSLGRDRLAVKTLSFVSNATGTQKRDKPLFAPNFMLVFNI